jgi:hypothetical protein
VTTFVARLRAAVAAHAILACLAIGGPLLAGTPHRCPHAGHPEAPGSDASPSHHVAAPSPSVHAAHDEAPDHAPAPDAPCRCIGPCHGLSAALPPPAPVAAAAAVPVPSAERRAGLEPAVPRDRATRLLPFSTAPPRLA